MKSMVRLFFAFVVCIMAFACTQDDYIPSIDDDYQGDNEHIKTISANGVIVHKFYYDDIGRIVEENSTSYFQRYLYDENNRLVKIESAFDESLLSSTYVERRTEFMTSQNSAVKNYSLFTYDKAGKLSKVEFYAKMTGNEFEHRSSQTFEYEDSNIKKINLHDDTGRITQYHIYTYDKNGNVTNDKHYTNNFGATNELISEISYKHDNYINPFRIFSMRGNPGMYSNANNIVETNLIRHEDVPGFDKYATGKISYEYNKNGYPVKEITQNGEWEYNY